MGEMRQGTDGGNESAWSGCGELPPLSLSYTVRRERLIRELLSLGRSTGAVIVCAPHGFGKTALLLQYVEEVRSDPARGSARLIEGGHTVPDELIFQIEMAEEQLSCYTRPLIAVDNLPVLEGGSVVALIDCVRAARDRGYELVLSCTPANRALLNAFGDSAKLGAQALKVNPREYADWARVFSLSPELDIYRLTQGVPLLVAATQGAVEISGRDPSDSLLENEVLELYRSVLAEVREHHDRGFSRLVNLMLLLGSGCLADLERCGVHPAMVELTMLVRDYPVFGLDAAERTFYCLGCEDGARRAIREEIAVAYPNLVMRAARIQVRAARVDAAVALVAGLLEKDQALEFIRRYPVQIALAGHGAFVCERVSAAIEASASRLDIKLVLARYLSSLIMGDYRAARAMASELRLRANEADSAVDPIEWMRARALADVWRTCRDIELPELAHDATDAQDPVVVALEVHLRAEDELLRGGGCFAWPVHAARNEEAACEVDVVRLLLDLDRLLDEVMNGTMIAPDERDERMAETVGVLARRRLTPLANRARLVLAARRVFSGQPVDDQRVWADVNTGAVRISDMGMQLLCMLVEGWSSFALSQSVSAQFRAQQVMKLAGDAHPLLSDWACLLEYAARICSSSQMMIQEEAELIDLVQRAKTPGAAWGVALHLSAARFDADLSAWFSANKAMLLGSGIRLPARLALHVLGERSRSARRLIPPPIRSEYRLGAEGFPAPEAQFELIDGSGRPEVGQVRIVLFGGFRVERNGHTLTDALWRRKKAGVLAARLVLSYGSFVSRQVLMDEMWPDVGYAQARNNLYAALSSLRHAIGQTKEGPQYVLTQGDGVALNTDYVIADTVQFDRFARVVLLKQARTAPTDVVDACLKIEQLYAGPLFVPTVGEASFFIRNRRLLLSKFTDCMIRGATVAVEEGNLSSASWLIEAALRHNAAREDVVRCAMRIFDLEGRRRELIDLYSSHLHYLNEELRTYPEPETSRLYEAIVERTRKRGVL